MSLFVYQDDPRHLLSHWSLVAPRVFEMLMTADAAAGIVVGADVAEAATVVAVDATAAPK